MAASDILNCKLDLLRMNTQNYESIFILRNEAGESIGRLSLFWNKVIDRSKGEGSMGKIKYPPMSYFPSRIICDRPLEKDKQGR